MSLDYARPKFKTQMKTKGRARGPSNVGSDDGNEVDTTKNITKVGTCNDPFPAPDLAYILCPKECPLLRFDPDMLCHWRCISEEKCNSYPGVIERESGYCRVCAVPGCRRCMSDRQECRECHADFDLKNGECITHATWKWAILISFLGVIVLALLLYIVHLAWRPVVSEGMLEWGLDRRSKQKARRDDANHELYDLNMSLADEVTSAGGIGANLHFSWQRMTILWSLSITLVLLALTYYHGRLNFHEIAQMSPMHDEAEGICTDRLEVLAEKDFESMRMDFLRLTGVIYVGSSLGAILWAWWQQNKFQRHDDATTTMQDYAVLCKGFPEELSASDASPKLEEEYLEFFRSTWGDSVIGVSISWNFDDCEQEVKDTVSEIVHKLVRKYKESRDTVKSEGSKKQEEEEEGHGIDEVASYISTPPGSERQSSSASGPRSRSRTGCFCRPMLDVIDGALFGDVPECMAQSDTKSPPYGDSKQDALELLSRIPVTGFCFVVFETEGDMRRCVNIPLEKFRGEHEITAERASGEAETVLWDGFSTSRAKLHWNMMAGVLQILLVIAIWTVCFWAPYTLYILSWQKTGGASQGDSTIGMVVGLLITAGNQIVYAVCGMISERAKFTSRDARDSYYTGLYTFAVLVNTVLDMWLITIMAKGWQRDAEADPYSLVRDPSMQHALFVQLIFYLWPCTLLLPFLLEPFVLNVGPYFLAKWLVRSRPDCTKQEAEECLALPPFDLNRYGDNLINIMMVVLFFILTNVTLWWIFLVLTISLLVIYAWDCYRFKRGTARTHFATQDIDVLSHYVMAIPCALLAGGFVFKLLGGQAMVSTWEPDSFLVGHPEVWSKVTAACAVHLIVHWMVLALVVPRLMPEPAWERGARDEEPYQATASLICCNWFNANPVHVIRSKYLYCHNPSHVFYQPGREFLHKRNDRDEDKDGLIIYEAPDFKQEESLLMDLRSASSAAFTRARKVLSERLASGPDGSQRAQTWSH